MDKKDFYYLGKITKTSGYSGNLMFFFDVDDIEKYKNLDAVFIDLHGELVPFVIRQIQFKDGKTAFVKLEDISKIDEATALIGCELYLPLSFLPKLTGKEFYFHEVIGFDVQDKTHGTLGKIEKVIDQGAQPLLVVKYKNKEILIPAIDEIIISIDRKNKFLTIKVPEGLIDIYI
jgi:16S rRNA processing protein RimM